MCEFCDSSPGYEKRKDNHDVLTYDPVENRRKHRHSLSEPKIVRCGSHWVGKCPSEMPGRLAHNLLNSGIREYRLGELDHPYSIWNVHEGIVYRARRNNTGDAWHGYPACQATDKATSSILKELRQRAKNQGFGTAQFNRWWLQNLSRGK